MKSSYPAICAALIAASILVPLETSEGQIPRSPQAESVVSEDYRIGPEAALIIVVWKNETLSRSVNVRPDGKISLPLINDIQAAGLTPSQLRDEIAKRLTAFMPPPEVSVLVNEVRSFKVSVLGEVQKPGRYELRGRTTVLDALALAGGFKEFASTRKIVILRSNGNISERRVFDYKRAIAPGGAAYNFELVPNDVILVPWASVDPGPLLRSARRLWARLALLRSGPAGRVLPDPIVDAVEQLRRQRLRDERSSRGRRHFPADSGDERGLSLPAFYDPGELRIRRGELCGASRSRQCRRPPARQRRAEISAAHSAHPRRERGLRENQSSCGTEPAARPAAHRASRAWLGRIDRVHGVPERDLSVRALVVGHGRILLRGARGRRDLHNVAGGEPRSQPAVDRDGHRIAEIHRSPVRGRHGRRGDVTHHSRRMDSTPERVHDGDRAGGTAAP